MLIHNPKGNYSFIKGIAPYSGGCVASDGFEIVHVRFRQPVALKQGFSKVAAHLKEAGRPSQALCAMELRSPAPFTFQGFAEFNAGYIGVLREWGILLEGGVNPVARTNVAPDIGAPAEPSLYGFAFTSPLKAGRYGRTFVVAGGGELPEGSLDPHDVVRRGETSPSALEEKIRFVMGLMTGRVRELGVTWDDATVVQIYTVHDVGKLLAAEVAGKMGMGQAHGMLWHWARPPILSIEYEMDLRGCRQELMLS